MKLFAMKKFFVLSCGIFCLISQSSRADWKEFRGPTGQGEATGTQLPVAWSDTKNVLWKSDVDGLAWSSPVIVDDHVYLTSAIEIADQQHSLRLLCLDLSSGDVIWEKEVFDQDGKVKMHKKNSHASPT